MEENNKKKLDELRELIGDETLEEIDLDKKAPSKPEDSDVRGMILMAKRTDPGWTILFPMVNGIIIERGSILSHSAVIAREMGIPLVAGIRGLTDKIHDGDIVEIDGINGTVRVIGEENGEQGF